MAAMWRVNSFVHATFTNTRGVYWRAIALSQLTLAGTEGDAPRGALS